MASSPPSSLLGCGGASPALSSAPPEFTFEGDHEALLGDPDYLSLLRALAVLQAQRARCVRDVDALLAARQRCLDDPLGTVGRLQRGEGLADGIPERQVLAEVPEIDWDKYSVAGGGAAPGMLGMAAAGGRKPETRGGGIGAAAPGKVEKNPLGQILVRGRVFEEGKPRTFNQPWTPEEQRRLEELLVQYPTEAVEMERWKKIAAALGNRTAIQVQSRTQKYFLKLQKAGLPIPGRQLKSRHRVGTPNLTAPDLAAPASSSSLNGAAAAVATTRSGRQLIRNKNSTFFPSLSPAVRMTEEEEEDGDGGRVKTEPASSSVFSDSPLPSPSSNRGPILNDGFYLEEEDVSEEEGVDESLRSSGEYQELMWLKRVRREQELEQQRPGGPLVHRLVNNYAFYFVSY